jgi:hypothetical protein
MVDLFKHELALSTSTPRQMGDYCLSGQVDRWKSKPLTTDDAKLAEFGSFKGRGACLLNFVTTPLREGFREGKNLLVVAEKVFSFVRVFFETLFREEGATWGNCGDRMKDVLTSVSALLARVVTVILDEFKLAAGILYPAAAIKAPEKNEEEINDDDVNDDEDVNVDEL